MTQKLGGEAGETFKQLCDEMFVASMKETYVSAKKALEEFISESSERHFLSSWLSWWHSRRVFIFGAFASRGAHKMNLAEVVHAG